MKVAFGLAAVGVVALLPLFGDPFPGSAVSHAEWARMVLRGLDLLSDEPGHNDTAQQVFAALSGRESRSFGADEYVRATRLEVEGQGNERRVRPSSGVGEAVYAVSIVRAGEYRLRLNVGAPAPPEAELTRAGDTAVLHRFSVPAGREVGWVEAGAVFLDPGAYETSVLLPEGAALQHVEVAPPCLQPIEPRGGWKASAVATTADVAMTVLQALDLESELPPSAAPIEIDGTELRLDNGSRAVTDAAHGFRAGARGARAILLVDVPQSGLYTLSAFGTPTGGHRWLADGCRTCFVCPSTDAVGRWQTILSAHLQKGRHLFTAALGPGSLIERLRLSPKRDEDADYLGTTRRLGLDLGEPGPISRDKAEEARRFIERRRVDALETCSATLRPGAMIADTVVSGAAGGAGGAGGGAGETGGETGGGTGAGGEAGGETGGGGGGGNVPPPIVPPLPPASPTVPTAFSPA